MFRSRDMANNSVWIRNDFFSDQISDSIRIVDEKYVWTADLQVIKTLQKSRFLKICTFFWIRIVDEKYIWTADNLNITEKLIF